MPARWRPGTSLTRPTISPLHCLSALASFVGYYQVPRAAARRLVADGGRQRCGCCFFRRDRRLTAPSANAAGAGHEAETIRVILHQPERPERPNAERPYRNPIGRRGLSWDALPMEFHYGRSAFGRSKRSGWCRMTLSRNVAGSICAAGGAPSTSAGRAVSAGASCAGGSACWCVVGIGGGTGILAQIARGIDADAPVGVGQRRDSNKEID